jgi:hypothetical protein
LKAARRLLTSRNASTAALASGTARNHCRKIPSAPTSPSALALAARTRRRIEKCMSEQNQDPFKSQKVGLQLLKYFVGLTEA